METATSSLSSENERKAEILRQIEFLKAQLNGNTTSCSKVVEEDDDETILAPATPSPSKSFRPPMKFLRLTILRKEEDQS